MDDLDDELDLRYHRNLNPDVYYRCPSSESLEGAIRNELEKSTSSFIPVHVVTEFVFSSSSTITVPVAHQPDLDALFEPADYPQSITVDHALCHGIEGKERLKLQRAVARCFLDAIQAVDGFRYTERQAYNRDGSDGVKFKYICLDSLQNRDRKRNAKKNDSDETQSGDSQKARSCLELPTYDCGGAVHIRFSTKREAINVVYVHNPIHRDVDSRPADQKRQVPNAQPSNVTTSTNGNSNGAKSKKRKKPPANQHLEADFVSNTEDLEVSESSEAPAVSTKKKRKKGATQGNESSSATKSKTKKKQAKAPSKAHSKPPAETLIEENIQPVTGKCLRCREKGFVCNKAKPTCNQCSRGLWSCQYEAPGPRKRSRNGCIICKSKKRKCTEEKPSCAYCLRTDNDCVYPESA